MGYLYLVYVPPGRARVVKQQRLRQGGAVRDGLCRQALAWRAPLISLRLECRACSPELRSP